MPAVESTLITPLILAGGTGTRLWPVSRDAVPKQFLPLAGPRSTYQQALLRVSDRALFAPPVVVTHETFRFIALQQAQELGIDPVVVLEPMRRDSGPAIAAGTAVAAQADRAALVLSMAADHVILDADLFLTAVRAAAMAAGKGQIVTFGIRPTAPTTGYGYIRKGPPLDGDGIFAVEAFVEKPDSATAARYVADGYLWNSGNFLFRADVLGEDLTRHAPELAAASAAAVSGAVADGAFLRLAEAAFGASPRISIDFAVMEKSQRISVVEGRFRWSDIGAWDALFDVLPGDDNGNAASGDAEFMDARRCLAHSGHGLTALVGVEDLVVVTTPDAVLVAHVSRAQEVKQLVSRLAERGRREIAEHRRGFRPWGYYDGVDRGQRFQVKRIVVRPGAALSLQKHLHRAEHWVVVGGTAEVTVDGVVQMVHENQSVYIPQGAVHRLANPGKIALELIEVQTGSYLGEDDIIRFEDVYHRA